MPHDLLTAVRLEGLRAVGSLDLTLRGAAVVVGPSGAGKSSLADALALLRACPSRAFATALTGEFGGARALAAAAGDSVVIAADFAGAGPPLRYALVVGERDGGSAVLAESLVRLDRADDDPAREILTRQAGTARYRVEGEPGLQPLAAPPQTTALASFGPSAPHSALRRAARALEQIRVHRGPPALDAAGDSSVWLGAHAEAALACAARGVPGLREVLLREAAGARATWVRLGGKRAPVSADALPGAQRAWLSLVALAFDPTPRSFAVLDEPAAGLDRARAALMHGALAQAAELAPVVLLTHDERAVDLATPPWPSAQVLRLGRGAASR